MLVNWRIAFCASFPAVFGLQKFEPATNVDAFFVEQFNYESLESSPWKTSKAVKDSEFQFNGVVNIEVPKVFNTFRGDKALVLKSKAQLHGVTR